MLKNVIVSMFALTMAGCHADTTVQSDAVNPQITDAVTQTSGVGTVTVEVAPTTPSSSVTCANGAAAVDGVCPDVSATVQTTVTTETPTSH
jgi:hypothetical protein